MNGKYEITGEEINMECMLTPLAQYILTKVCETKPAKLAGVHIENESLALFAGGWYEYRVRIKPIPKKDGGMK